MEASLKLRAPNRRPELIVHPALEYRAKERGLHLPHDHLPVRADEGHLHLVTLTGDETERKIKQVSSADRSEVNSIIHSSSPTPEHPEERLRR